MNIKYCGDICPIGRVKSEEFLTMNNSAFDAAMDFIRFTEDCFKNCPYSQHHGKDTQNFEIVKK